MRRFLVTAEHTPRGWWVLEAPEVGAVSQVRRIDRAADEMREAIAWLANIPEAEVEVQVLTVLPEEFTAAKQSAVELRTQAERLQTESAAARRQAARALSDRGYSVRDIGTLMEISPQRVSQLLNSTPNTPPNLLGRAEKHAVRSEKTQQFDVKPKLPRSTPLAR